MVQQQHHICGRPVPHMFVLYQQSSIVWPTSCSRLLCVCLVSLFVELSDETIASVSWWAALRDPNSAAYMQWPDRALMLYPCNVSNIALMQFAIISFKLSVCRTASEFAMTLCAFQSRNVFVQILYTFFVQCLSFSSAVANCGLREGCKHRAQNIC